MRAPPPIEDATSCVCAAAAGPRARVTSGVAVSVSAWTGGGRAAATRTAGSADARTPFAIRTCVCEHSRRARLRSPVITSRHVAPTARHRTGPSVRPRPSWLVFPVLLRRRRRIHRVRFCRLVNGLLARARRFASRTVNRRPAAATRWHERRARAAAGRRRRRGCRVVAVVVQHAGRRLHRVRRRAAGRRGRDAGERRQRDRQTDVVRVTGYRVRTYAHWHQSVFNKLWSKTFSFVFFLVKSTTQGDRIRNYILTNCYNIITSAPMGHSTVTIDRQHECN